MVVHENNASVSGFAKGNCGYLRSRWRRIDKPFDRLYEKEKYRI